MLVFVCSSLLCLNIGVQIELTLLKTLNSTSLEVNLISKHYCLGHQLSLLWEDEYQHQERKPQFEESQEYLSFSHCTIMNWYEQLIQN